jgi:hypothetical protein
MRGKDGGARVVLVEAFDLHSDFSSGTGKKVGRLRPARRFFIETFVAAR